MIKEQFRLNEDWQLALIDFCEQSAPPSIRLLRPPLKKSSPTNLSYLQHWEMEAYDAKHLHSDPFPTIRTLNGLSDSVASLFNITTVPNFASTKEDVDNIHTLPDHLTSIVKHYKAHLQTLQEVENAFRAESLGKTSRDKRDGKKNNKIITHFEAVTGSRYLGDLRESCLADQRIYTELIADADKFIKNFQSTLSAEGLPSREPGLGRNIEP